jgi:Zn-dependent M28 family amino/carboxypeptidase
VGASSLAGALLLAACASASQPVAPAGFDGARAFAHLERIVAIGPRPAGSPGAGRTRRYITDQLTALGLTVDEQPFEAATPRGPVRMVNLRVIIGGATDRPRLILAGHYDTKRFEDATFVGANDGGSSTAFLIEMARVFAARPPALPVELLFLDGEEAVVAWTGDDHTYGSRHYVAAARRDGSLARIGALVLVDMIADRDLRLRREEQSTPWLTEIIWSRARAMGRPEFVDESTPINDDHLPFLAAGVPAVDIIDLDYPAWHTPADTLDQTSAASLQAVADVLLAAWPDIERRISR